MLPTERLYHRENRRSYSNPKTDESHGRNHGEDHFTDNRQRTKKYLDAYESQIWCGRFVAVSHVMPASSPAVRAFV